MKQLSYDTGQANSYLIVERGHAGVIGVCFISMVEEIKNRDQIPDNIFLTRELYIICGD